jgi:hypothetical protein
MSLTGVSAEFGYAGGDGYDSAQQPIVTGAYYSETIASGSTSAKGATGGGHRKTVVHLEAEVAHWVARGTAPDPSKAASLDRNSVRFYLKAGGQRDIYLEPGDLIAVLAA